MEPATRSTPAEHIEAGAQRFRNRGTVAIFVLLLCAGTGLVLYGVNWRARQRGLWIERQAAASRLIRFNDAVKNGDLRHLSDTIADRNEEEIAASLFSASHAGNTPVVRLLLTRATSLYPFDLEVALRAAAGNGYDDVVALLFRAGARGDMPDPSGYPLLALAARGGHEAVARLILDHGAKVNEPVRAPPKLSANKMLAREEGFTPLMLASLGGHVSVAKLLLERGAEVNAKSGGGFSALALCRRGLPPLDASRAAGAGGLSAPRAMRIAREAERSADRKAVERVLLSAGARE